MNIAALVAAVFVLVGCASTSTFTFGELEPDFPLTEKVPLVEMTFTDSLDTVRSLCKDTPAIPGLRHLGCRLPLLPVKAQGKLWLAAKIVIFADPMPKDATLEVIAHEVCHAIAGVQRMPDPCHNGNHGILKNKL